MGLGVVGCLVFRMSQVRILELELVAAFPRCNV